MLLVVSSAGCMWYGGLRKIRHKLRRMQTGYRRVSGEDLELEA